MESLILEIRSGEGGADAKLLVKEQLGIYGKYAKRLKLQLDLLEFRVGYVSLRVSGRGAVKAFSQEGGGHRWQRVPPTEKRGRVHSSTITVAVLQEPASSELTLKSQELKFENYRASGPGGQHRNTTDSAVRVTHLPTGVQACAETKSQHRNKSMALAVLRARLLARRDAEQESERNTKRRAQVGSGMRSDKVRTVAEQRNRVENHLNGKRASTKRYLRGFVEEIL